MQTHVANIKLRVSASNERTVKDYHYSYQDNFNSPHGLGFCAFARAPNRKKATSTSFILWSTKKKTRSQVQNKFCLNLYALITWFSPRHTKPFDWFSSFEKLCIVILWSKMRKKNTRKGHPVYWKPKAEVFFHLCFGSKLKPQPAAGGTCSVCC